MKYLALIFGTIFSIGILPAYCAPDPSTQSSKHDTILAPSAPGSLNVGNTTQLGAPVASPHDNAWHSVLSDPVAVFTFFLAVFTLLLFWESAASNKRRLRAYVLVDSIGMWDGTTLNPPQPHRANVPGVVIVFKNSGQTPAHKVISWAQIAVIEPINENTLIVPPLQHQSSSTLGINSTLTKSIWFHRALTANEITDLAQGIRAIYIFGRVEYLDSFNRKLHSNFRVSYSGAFPNPPNVTFLFSDAGNDSN